MGFLLEVGFREVRDYPEPCTTRPPEERSLFFLVIPRSGATWGSLRLARAFEKEEIDFAIGEIATSD